MKRKRQSSVSHRKKKQKTPPYKESCITEEYLQKYQEKFNQNPSNAIIRNTVTSVGSFFSTMNSNRVNEISHVFMNTVKKRHLKATNQGASGRCWMFAALNTFRHAIIKALELENFEFSETYLFFWDKFERSNSYMQWFINNQDQIPPHTDYSREFEFMITDYMGDGGWWTTFANLVEKYGLIPKNAMKETYQSEDSEDMNHIIEQHLHEFVNNLRTGKKCSKEETLQKIYNTLVKFLGEPPESFNWGFTTDEDETNIATRLTPHTFKELVLPGVNVLDEFVTLANIPSVDYYKLYRIRLTNNVYEGQMVTVLNVPSHELSKCAIKSLSAGMAVWFGGDVCQAFNWFHSSLDDKLDDSHLAFEIESKMSKSDRVILRNVNANHAMALTGFNLDEKGKPLNWQVENSWGYWDNETPGLDGFLNMSQSWFEKYVMEIVVHKNFLSRNLQNKMKTKPHSIDPWDSMAPALKIGVVNPPKQYLNLNRRKH